MKTIPETIVERTWQEFAGFSPDKANQQMMKINNKQPDLVAFVVESCKEMGRK